VTNVVHGVNVTVPAESVYVPTFATVTVVATQFGALVPGAQRRVELAVKVTPLGARSLLNRSELCTAPTTPDVTFAVADDAGGGVTVGVIVDDADCPAASTIT
jgi:hypothetical protein